jgi:nucleoid DNA-binding protein/cell division septation protein DedD
MLGNYFRELLEKHNRVIIPDFGAFLVKDTGDIRSLANISFSPFLRYNDGLVEAFLSEKDGLTKAEATNQVKEYVDSLKAQLDKGVQVELPKLGYFYKDARGTIQFQLDLTGESPIPNIKDDVVPLAINEQNQVEATPTKEEREPTLAQDTPERSEKEEIKVVEEPNISVEKQKVLKQPSKPTITEKKTKVKVALPVKKEEKKTPESNPIDQRMAQTVNKKGSSSKSGKGYWLLITSLIILLIVIIWQYDNIVKVFNSSNSEKAAINNVIAVDSLSADSMKINNDSITATKTTTAPVYVKPVIDKPENKFLVVVGSFTSKANAETQLKNLIDQGYQPIIILRNNGLHSVVISGHTTKEEAQLSLESYTKKNGEGWIMSR